MKKIVIFLIFLNLKVFSQCPIKVYGYPSSIFCGDSLNLSALHSISQPLNANFNSGNIDDLLIATTNARVVDSTDTVYSCFGHAPEGSHFLFMTTSTDTPRYVQTKPLDLLQDGAVGGTLCFMMRYGLQKGLGSDNDLCEGIEGITEGVYLEYYTATKNSWFEINYFNPNTTGDPILGGLDSVLTNWNRYCFKLPQEAMTNSTRFRLIQKDCNGAGFDAWAIDDFSIVLDIEGYKFDWLHDNLPPNVTSETPLVAPTSDTTYTVYYSNGKNSCSGEIKINVLPPRDIKTASAECLCSHLYIPNAFTPNNDGINDIFLPITFNVIEYELEIYNRYGLCIFKTKNYQEGWNGRINNSNEPQQQDVYLYNIKIRNFDKKLHYYIGNIVIVK